MEATATAVSVCVRYPINTTHCTATAHNDDDADGDGGGEDVGLSDVYIYLYIESKVVPACCQFLWQLLSTLRFRTGCPLQCRCDTLVIYIGYPLFDVGMVVYQTPIRVVL